MLKDINENLPSHMWIRLNRVEGKHWDLRSVVLSGQSTFLLIVPVASGIQWDSPRYICLPYTTAMHALSRCTVVSGSLSGKILDHMYLYHCLIRIYFSSSIISWGRRFKVLSAFCLPHTSMPLYSGTHSSWTEDFPS